MNNEKKSFTFDVKGIINSTLGKINIGKSKPTKVDNVSNFVSANEMLRKAFENKYAVAQFNINNLEWTKTILEVCQEMKSPVILGASEGAVKYMGGYNVVAKMVMCLIHDLKITVPVALHLDHGSSYESCEKAIVGGFTSVMIDKSHDTIDTNITITKQVMELANKYDVSVEAEVGTVGGEEDGVVGEAMYAKFEECEKLVKETKVHFFAPAVGSVHGHYKGEPKLGFDVMEKVSKELNIPIVLHGGSGIPDEQVKRAITCGISKINVNTDLQEAFNKGLEEYFLNGENKKPKGYDPRKITKPGTEEMRKVLKNKIILFGSDNKA